ncbi:MAG: polyribonucleotide nucleotidyltransferase [Mycoplasmatales bacterium]
MKNYKLKFNNKDINFNIGEMAKQADGAVFVSFGGTDFLVTAVKKELEEEKDFFPLVINYEEKMYASGKIPGNYGRREAKPTEQATLNARMIDRPLRPLFPETFNYEVQIVITILSYDNDYEPQMLAVGVASLASRLAELPLTDLVAGLSISKINDEYIINPNFEQRKLADNELKITGTLEAVNMIEFKGNEVQEEEVLKMIAIAHEEIKKLIKFQEEILQDLQITKVEYQPPLRYTKENLESVTNKYAKVIENILLENTDKKIRNARLEEIKKEIITTFNEEEEKQAKEIFETIYKNIFIKLVVENKYRVDGRGLDEIRKLASRIDVLQKTHGSALFTRGETQALAVCTLGVKNDEQILDGLEDEDTRRFMLHYNFPPYSVGEAGRMGAPGRREIGHGFLAQKALEPILPSVDDFPYTIRLVSEILESNGSSSQATICAATLALMNAGVPITKPVAGIAMGLIKQAEEFTILTDIAGLEDHLGDMDFKVAGTCDGITAIQMDIKIKGITFEIFEQGLEQAKKGRLQILKHMKETIAMPAKEVNENAPKIEKLQIAIAQIKEVIGRGGETINKIIEKTGVKIDISDEGQVLIFGVDKEKVQQAKEIIQSLTKVYKVGEKFPAEVMRIESFGAFVKFDGKQEALLHISKLSDKRVDKVEDILSLNDKIMVEIISVEGKNKIKVKLNEKQNN